MSFQNDTPDGIKRRAIQFSTHGCSSAAVKHPSGSFRMIQNQMCHVNLQCEKPELDREREVGERDQSRRPFCEMAGNSALPFAWLLTVSWNTFSAQF